MYVLYNQTFIKYWVAPIYWALFFIFQLYHATFILSAHSLNFSGDIFSLAQLQEEFQDRILFGFLEGIWSLDILYQGQRPIPNTVEESEDELQDSSGNRKDQENYKRDFFLMLEDVVELSSDFPNVLIDPEFSINRHN